MSEGKDVFEFLSRCWVPFIALEHGIYYAFGNTRMLDFLRDFKVNSKMDILVLGLGDVRHVMKTVAGLSQRPPSSFGEVKEIHFNLNDVDKDVIARDIILLEITNKLDPESKSDAEFLWSVWYNAFMVEKDFRRLNVILEDLIDKYSNSSRDSERICEFGDKLSLKSVLKTWNCWMKRKLNQSAVKQSRLESLEFDAKIKPFSYNDIAQYASMQVYVDRGIKDSDVEIVGKEMLTAARDGFVNFSEDRKKDRKDFANPTFMRPGCEEWLVEDGACAAACYLPLQKKFIEKHSSIHEACFEKMRETISSYHETWKMVKVTYTLWATDLFHLCHWLMPSDMKFDFIFTSNLMDYVGLINLLLITQPRLKNSQSVLVTESFNWNKFYKTLEELLNKDLMCNYMHLPSMIGLRMAEDLDFGISHLQGFYRTTISRLSDSELIYWTKSFNQENIRIDLEASPEVKYALFFLLASTFWSHSTAAALSRIKQTPLALMYCFQRLQNLIKGGMATLLEYVELEINGRTMDFSRNRMTWDVVCWAFGQKHKGDQLCIVKIPFKDVNSSLTAMITHGKVNCRLKLEYDTSSSKEEVLSLFQYDAVDQHFRVPILESAWKALPDSTTMMVINRDGENSPPLHQLSRPNRKVPFKKEGIVVATYYEQKRYDAATTDSFLFQTLFCSEEAEKYRMQDAFVEAKASLDLWCKLIVSDSNNDMAAESTAVAKFPYIFSCPVVSYEIYDVRENFIQAALYKQKTFNTGRTALPFRLIDDSELLPFTCGQDIRNYLEETMICDLMFCSPTDIESRATALIGPVLLTDDAFLALRIVIEQLWHLGSKREKTLPHVVRIEIQEQTKTSPVMILDVQGYYMYGGLPLVKMRFVELDRNSADLKTSKETTTIYAKYPRCLELLKKMLFTNSLRMSQERLTASVNITASSSQSLNTFLQMVFLSDDGRVMQSALHEYPINTCLVKHYIEKIYSASIRQNFVAPRKARDILRQQMKESISSYFAERRQFPSGEHKPDSATSKNLSSLPLNQRTSCSECKKSTRPIDLKKCSRCMSVAYCSKDCQVKDWPKHKNECSSDLFKTDDGSSTNRSNKSGCPTESKNLSGSLRKKSITLDTNEPRIKIASSTKKIENDPSTKAKIEDCSSVGSNSEDSFVIYRRESKTNSEEDSALKPKTEYCISNSKNPDCGASAKTEDGDHSFALEANDAISYLESAFEDSAKAYKSSLQSKFQANNSAKKKNEVDSSLKDMNPSQSHLQKIKTNFQNDAIADNWVGLRSGELCTYCRLENSNMKKCVQCKSAAYCSRECQRADWKRHMSECETQQFPSTVPLMSRCNSCGALGTEMKKCSQCKSTCYCSPECQRRDWKTHKITCRRP